jgi:hypothetical protein
MKLSYNIFRLITIIFLLEVNDHFMLIIKKSTGNLCYQIMYLVSPVFICYIYYYQVQYEKRIH